MAEEDVDEFVVADDGDQNGGAADRKSEAAAPASAERRPDDVGVPEPLPSEPPAQPDDYIFSFHGRTRESLGPLYGPLLDQPSFDTAYSMGLNGEPGTFEDMGFEGKRLTAVTMAWARGVWQRQADEMEALHSSAPVPKLKQAKDWKAPLEPRSPWDG